MLISASGQSHQNQQIVANPRTPEILTEDILTEETHLLLPQYRQIRPQRRSQPLKDSILIKTASFGTNGLFLAAHIALNGKLLTMIGEKGAAAGALASTYLSVILGTGVGILLSTGLHIGPSIGQKDYREAGDIAKTAWILTGLVGGISSATMFAARSLFPLLFEQETAQVASEFFSGYGAIGIPILMLVTNPQIAFQAGDWYIPPVVSLMFFSAGAMGSYLLAFPAKLGALGVGLGGTFAAAATSLFSQVWFSRDHYKPYQFYALSIPGFREKVKSLLETGWQLSFQRMTEWGSLMLMTTVIGLYGNKALTVSQPAIQYTGLLASAVQSLAQAIGMILARNKGVITHAEAEQDESLALEWYQKNVKTVNLNNMAAAVAMAVMAACFYIEREPLASFFLPDKADSETKKLAETLLWISMVGMIADAVRITGIGALRGWKDITFPTVASFVTMIVIGAPLGWAFGQALGNETAWMFHARNAMVLIAAAITLDRCRKQLSADEKRLRESFQRAEEESITTLATPNQTTIDIPSPDLDLAIDRLFATSLEDQPHSHTQQETQNQQNRLIHPHTRGIA